MIFTGKGCFYTACSGIFFRNCNLFIVMEGCSQIAISLSSRLSCAQKSEINSFSIFVIKNNDIYLNY